MIQIIQAESLSQIDTVRDLFLEYAESLDFALCFQGFDEELASLPGDYVPPNGRLYLATMNERVAGCVALRKTEKGICEMKRLWVRPDFRGNRIGRMLVSKVIVEARSIGYRKMLLDTVSSMREAISLYEALGFKKAEPYYNNPIEGTIYMEMDL